MKTPIRAAPWRALRVGHIVSSRPCRNHLAADRENYRRAWAFALEHGLGEELIALVKGMVAFGFDQGDRPDAYCQQAIQALQMNGVPASDRSMLYLQVLDLSDLDHLDLVANEVAPLLA